MTYEAAQTTALDLIAVHGREALEVATTCVRAMLHCAEPDAVHAWLQIVEAIQRLA